MTPKTLRVLSRGSAMVCNLDALPVRRFVGRAWDEDAKSFVASVEPVEVPYRHEYAQAVREGDLWAADAETAKACRVTLDSQFVLQKSGEKA